MLLTRDVLFLDELFAELLEQLKLLLHFRLELLSVGPLIRLHVLVKLF